MFDLVFLRLQEELCWSSNIGVSPPGLSPGPAHWVRRLTGLLSRLQRSACGCVMHQIPHILRRPTGSNPAFAPDGLSLSPFREVSAPVEFGYEYRGIPVDRSYAVVKVHGTSTIAGRTFHVLVFILQGHFCTVPPLLYNILFCLASTFLCYFVFLFLHFRKAYGTMSLQRST